MKKIILLMLIGISCQAQPSKIDTVKSLMLISDTCRKFYTIESLEHVKANQWKIRKDTIWLSHDDRAYWISGYAILQHIPYHVEISYGYDNTDPNNKWPNGQMKLIQLLDDKKIPLKPYTIIWQERH